MTSLITQAALTGGVIPDGLDAAIEKYDGLTRSDVGVIGDATHGLAMLNAAVNDTILAVRNHLSAKWANVHDVTIESSYYTVYLSNGSQSIGFIRTSRRAKATVTMKGVATTVYVPIYSIR